MKTNRVLAGTLALLLIGGFGTPVFAVPVEQIVNGDFETGSFAPWTIINSGSGNWVINDGTINPGGPLGTIAPISGSFDAMSLQGGPGTHILSETFLVPAGITSAIVSWDDRIFNNAGVFSDPNQEVRVEIRDSTGTTVLFNIFSTDPGDPLIQAGPNARLFDITTALQSLNGQSVRLCFVEQDNLTFFNYIVDNISLTIDTTTVGGEYFTLDTTALLVAGLQTNLAWIIPLLAAAGIGAVVLRKKF